MDIRDHINYLEIMKQYELGPNGAITTCLNLMCSKINILTEKIQEIS